MRLSFVQQPQLCMNCWDYIVNSQIVIKICLKLFDQVTGKLSLWLPSRNGDPTLFKAGKVYAAKGEKRETAVGH